MGNRPLRPAAINAVVNDQFQYHLYFTDEDGMVSQLYQGLETQVSFTHVLPANARRPKAHQRQWRLRSNSMPSIARWKNTQISLTSIMSGRMKRIHSRAVHGTLQVHQLRWALLPPFQHLANSMYFSARLTARAKKSFITSGKMTEARRKAKSGPLMAPWSRPVIPPQ